MRPLQLSTFIDRFLELIFPEKCIGCRVARTSLCLRCMETIPLLETTDDREIHALFPYEHAIIKKALWLLKYRGRKTIAGPLGRALYAAALPSLGEIRLWSGSERRIRVVPIPLSRQHLKKRGYNQAELIARGAVQCDTENILCLDTESLIRIRETESQVLQPSRTARLRNVADCFAVRNPSLLQNATVVLIDDTTTTGATLREAQRTLFKNGAKEVVCWAVAHGR